MRARVGQISGNVLRLSRVHFSSGLQNGARIAGTLDTAYAGRNSNRSHLTAVRADRARQLSGGIAKFRHPESPSADVADCRATMLPDFAPTGTSAHSEEIYYLITLAHRFDSEMSECLAPQSISALRRSMGEEAANRSTGSALPDT